MHDQHSHIAGVDLGGSLTKIVHNASPYQFAIYPSNDLPEIVAYLKTHQLTHLILTGGGSVKERAAFADFEVETADEFESNIRGANCLLEEQGGIVFPYALASVGTGTSISKVDSEGGHRFTGTAVGGGTLLGLGQHLTGESSYEGILARAAAGDRASVDVRVIDIYGTDLPGLSGDITASNFGKSQPASPEDLGRAMLQMVGEVIGVIACLAAQNMGAQQVVYLGASLRNNPVLQEVLDSVTRFMGREPRFLQNSEFAGALGALLQANR